MKKTIILMGIAALAFASCTKDTVKEINNGRAIDFRVAADTRATETTTANLNQFFVTALTEAGANYFTDAAYTKNDTYFSSTPEYYWPGAGSLTFYAYAPSAKTLRATVTINRSKKTIEGYTPSTTIANQIDLVATTAEGSKKDNENTGVALVFNHQLAQIEVKAKNENNGYVYQIKGVRIAQAACTGNLDLATGSWELVSKNNEVVKDVYDITYATPITLSNMAANLMASEGDNAMLIPQQLVAWNPTDKTNTAKGAYLSVLAQIETADGARVYPKATGSTYAWIAVPINTNWEAGYKYVYTLDFTEGAGYPDPDGGDDTFDKILGSTLTLTTAVEGWKEKQVADSPLVGTWNIAEVKSVFTSTHHENVYEHTWTTEDIEAGLVENVYQIRFTNATTFYLKDVDTPLTVTKHDGKDLFFFDEENGNYIYIDNDSPFTLKITHLAAEGEDFDASDYNKEEVYIYYNKQ